MLSFAVYTGGKPAERVNLSGAYLIGSDDVALRADLAVVNGVIQCKKRSAGPAGIVILWNVPGVGEVLVESVRLMEREKPYILQVELARGRLLRISQKLEDWGMISFVGDEVFLQRIVQAKEELIRALNADTPAEAASLGDQALATAASVSEDLSRFHAEAFWGTRVKSGGFAPQVLGCAIDLEKPTDLTKKRIANAFDFVTLPIVWRDVEPNEQTFNYAQLDAWVEALTRLHIPIQASALLSFSEEHVPDWLYIWEHDFDTIRDLAFEHVRRILNRYGQYIQVWDVISGIHANNCFTFSFEQLMELTRMACALVKQVAPQSTALIDLVSPWGEYYARNQRTIPPLLYADMAVQSGVNFDALGLQLFFGPGVDGMYVRDMFQISCLIDQFSKLGKMVHITAVQVPSSTEPPEDEAGRAGVMNGGHWHDAWSEDLQAEWLGRFVQVALSKPFVETVSWRGLTDHKNQAVPCGGLLSSGLAPKAAYARLMKIRSELR